MINSYIQDNQHISKSGRVVIFLHGLGGSGTRDKNMADRFDNALVMVPDAPIALPTPDSYAWYFCIEDDVVRTDLLLESAEKLRLWIEQLPEQLGFIPADIMIAGFSQGGTMATVMALLYPGLFQLSANFGGYIALDPRIEATPEIVRCTKFFWAHGNIDDCNPYPVAVKGMQRLVDHGADLTVVSMDRTGHCLSGTGLESLLLWWSLHAPKG